MEPLTAERLTGTWAAVLLPLGIDDRIDTTRLGDEVEALADAGVDGIYTHGTAGELHAVDDDEFDMVSRLVAEICERRSLPFQIGASHMSAQLSLGRIRRAAALRPSAIQVMLPDWCPVSDDEAVVALDRMSAEAGTVPLVLYNPPHAKVQLAPASLARLARSVPQLIGVKVTGGDAEWFAYMRLHAPQLALFTAGQRLASCRPLGAAGAYTNVACLNPAGAVRWFTMMDDEPESALALEERINQFLDAHILPLAMLGYSNPALDKALAYVGAWADIGIRVRWPYRSVPEEVAFELRSVARRLMPELFA